MERGPVFVGGLERTGTSLMYALLASHPNLAMTRRMNWWTFFYGRFGDLADARNLDRCLGAMMRYRRHRKLDPDVDRLRRDFLAGNRSYERLFALLEQQHAERLGRTRWGDKSLHTERYTDLIFDAFPGARILHMVRDPRDRYASALRRWKVNRGGVGVATAMWLASVQLGERSQERYPEQYRIVRYETLVAEPEETLRDLCRFIDEPYEPQMLTLSGAEIFRESGGNSSYGERRSGISTASVGRFQSVMSPAEIAFMQRRAGDRMQAHGYELDPARLSAIARLHYAAIHAPVNLLRMAAWRARERLYDLTGRAPSEHTILDAEPA